MTGDSRYNIIGVLTLAQAQGVPGAALAEQQPVWTKAQKRNQSDAHNSVHRCSASSKQLLLSRTHAYATVPSTTLGFSV